MILEDIWSRFLGGDLYTRATYTRVYTVAVLAVVSVIDLNARVDEDEVCAAQLRYADQQTP